MKVTCVFMKESRCRSAPSVEADPQNLQDSLIHRKIFAMHEDDDPVVCLVLQFLAGAFKPLRLIVCSPSNGFIPCESSLLFVTRFFWLEEDNSGCFLCFVNPFQSAKGIRTSLDRVLEV